MDNALMMELITGLGLPGLLVVFLLKRESAKEAERAKEIETREKEQNDRFAKLEEFCRTTMLEQLKESNKQIAQNKIQQEHIIRVTEECTKVMQKLRFDLNKNNPESTRY